MRISEKLICRLVIAATAMAGALLSSCSNADTDTDWIKQQRASLNYVFFKDNPLPPAPSTEELQLAEEKVRAANNWERELLLELYAGDPELLALAILDSDGDGIFDFRISDYYGRFMEGDVDLDGDGVDNVLDAAPFNSAAATDPLDEVPAHVSWATQGRPVDMVQIQRELYRQHRILLVERSADFTPELAQSVYDVVNRVYSDLFADNGTLSTLRVISTEETSLLDADDEEGSGDFAQVLAATQTMEIYRRGIDAVPAIQLGYLIHEIGHNLQFAFDYDAQRREEIIRRNYYIAPNFYDLVANYGWTLEHFDADPEAEYVLFRPQYASQEPFDNLYWNESVEDWEAWLTEIYDEVGEDAYLTDERVTELHILGDYSISGPWEWYSDHLIAYVFIAMIDAVKENCSTADWNALRDSFQKEVVQAEWPYFRFENGRGAEIQNHLAKTYPMRATDVDYMARKYLRTEPASTCAVGAP